MYKPPHQRSQTEHKNLTSSDKECNSAALSGNYVLLKNLHTNGKIIDTETMIYAVIGGNLDAVKYCSANGCRMNCDTSYTAASNARVDIFKWLIDSGCPRDAKRCIQVGPPEIATWFKTR